MSAGTQILDAVLDALAERIAEKLDARHPAPAATPEPVAQPAVWLTEREAAARLGIAAKTLEGWRAAGRSPKFSRLNGRVIRYRTEDIDAFARRGRP